MKIAVLALLAGWLVPFAFCQSALEGRGTKSAGDIPSCKDSLSTVEVPSAPHGLFIAVFPGHRASELARERLLHNPVICGASIFMTWDQVDQGSGRYNWSSVDEEIAPWIAAGKIVNLVVWATGYNEHAKATPDYVFATVPSVSCERFGRVPVFWHKDFIKNYQDFMAALVDKYGGRSSIGYIRFGLGAGGETFPACMHAFREYGFSKERWRSYVFQMLDYEKSLNSPKLLMVALNTFGNPPDLSFTHAVAERAAGDGIAIASQGLSLEDAQRDQSGEPCRGDWCGIFREKRGKVPFELQTLHRSQPDRSGPVGSIVDLLPFGLQLHVQMFEIYLQDWMVAYDPNDPEYAQHHEEYQKAYEAAARVLGGSS
jgi:hypothetical protein